MSDLEYAKPALNINEQYNKLCQQKLIINDEEETKSFLLNNSLFRFRSYSYFFQEMKTPGKPFKNQVCFNDIIDLYDFDNELRLLVFKAIQKIEIAVRNQIIYEYSIEYGSHWHLDSKHFHNIDQYSKFKEKIDSEEKRDSGKDIQKYKQRYPTSKSSACWIIFDVISFTSLSLMFGNLNKSVQTKNIVKHFGLNNYFVLRNWIYCLTVLRNICAHHSRLWNRELIDLQVPAKTSQPFTINQNKPKCVYSYLCCLQYLLNQVDKNNTFKTDLKNLFSNYSSSLYLIEMGFPHDWEKEEFWCS
ncbi:hypothetical protein MmiAt1_04190 [Methanimicrococcus sp. At1]|uniref:Abortive infection bacteriophage resistance protein n=1 Tax=Methanimicrococcus hacksteinii TaxID=3028293 RepID=A0ABU3VN85_9EURY|nr:Abi family protein [Methanimicrococcus sp. At1]MDV0444874.1 hypothetical protein [Methanimicrococcus sp. At1]